MYFILTTWFSPSGISQFSVKVEDNAIQCRTGRQHPDGKANVVFAREGLSPDEIIDKAIGFLKTKGATGIRIGSNKNKPHSNTFEAFLRDFSNKGQLGSYMPPILIKLGLAEYVPPVPNINRWIRYKS